MFELSTPALRKVVALGQEINFHWDPEQGALISPAGNEFDIQWASEKRINELIETFSAIASGR